MDRRRSLGEDIRGQRRQSYCSQSSSKIEHLTTDGTAVPSSGQSTITGQWSRNVPPASITSVDETDRSPYYCYRPQNLPSVSSTSSAATLTRQRLRNNSNVARGRRWTHFSDDGQMTVGPLAVSSPLNGRSQQYSAVNNAVIYHTNNPRHDNNTGKSDLSATTLSNISTTRSSRRLNRNYGAYRSLGGSSASLVSPHQRSLQQLELAAADGAWSSPPANSSRYPADNKGRHESCSRSRRGSQWQSDAAADATYRLGPDGNIAAPAGRNIPTSISSSTSNIPFSSSDLPTSSAAVCSVSSKRLLQHGVVDSSSTFVEGHPAFSKFSTVQRRPGRSEHGDYPRLPRRPTRPHSSQQQQQDLTPYRLGPDGNIEPAGGNVSSWFSSSNYPSVFAATPPPPPPPPPSHLGVNAHKSHFPSWIPFFHRPPDVQSSDAYAYIHSEDRTSNHDQQDHESQHQHQHYLPPANHQIIDYSTPSLIPQQQVEGRPDLRHNTATPQQHSTMYTIQNPNKLRLRESRSPNLDNNNNRRNSVQFDSAAHPIFTDPSSASSSIRYETDSQSFSRQQSIMNSSSQFSSSVSSARSDQNLMASTTSRRPRRRRRGRRRSNDGTTTTNFQHSPSTMMVTRGVESRGNLVVNESSWWQRIKNNGLGKRFKIRFVGFMFFYTITVVSVAAVAANRLQLTSCPPPVFSNNNTITNSSSYTPSSSATTTTTTSATSTSTLLTTSTSLTTTSTTITTSTMTLIPTSKSVSTTTSESSITTSTVSTVSSSTTVQTDVFVFKSHCSWFHGFPRPCNTDSNVSLESCLLRENSQSFPVVMNGRVDLSKALLAMIPDKDIKYWRLHLHQDLSVSRVLNTTYVLYFIPIIISKSPSMTFNCTFDVVYGIKNATNIQPIDRKSSKQHRSSFEGKLPLVVHDKLPWIVIYTMALFCGTLAAVFVFGYSAYCARIFIKNYKIQWSLDPFLTIQIAERRPYVHQYDVETASIHLP